ncbi:hypothetical protein FHU38_004168 [Saccharomonospora amisosensis]|uniref:Uncharacterized protein n=1 Tax=Saccharomonospora amisosensis TaxID=1128677 RepID=A0A7X5ZSC9_9PSEU|nr:hypothetical protein [Saccharomonospora amisosensis]NIJ13824.1 hypothetical protein [Saccharomonospora amisosensis]
MLADQDVRRVIELGWLAVGEQPALAHVLADRDPRLADTMYDTELGASHRR